MNSDYKIEEIVYTSYGNKLFKVKILKFAIHRNELLLAMGE